MKTLHRVDIKSNRFPGTKVVSCKFIKKTTPDSRPVVNNLYCSIAPLWLSIVKTIYNVYKQGLHYKYTEDLMKQSGCTYVPVMNSSFDDFPSKTIDHVWTLLETPTPFGHSDPSSQWASKSRPNAF